MRTGGVIECAAVFARDERGATLFEYSILIGLVLVSALSVMFGVASWVNGTWSQLEATLP